MRTVETIENEIMRLLDEAMWLASPLDARGDTLKLEPKCAKALWELMQWRAVHTPLQPTEAGCSNKRAEVAADDQDRHRAILSRLAALESAAVERSNGDRRLAVLEVDQLANEQQRKRNELVICDLGKQIGGLRERIADVEHAIREARKNAY